MSNDDRLPPSYESRLSALEARVLALESRLGTSAPSSLPPTGPAPGGGGDTDLWLQQVSDLATRGDRDGAIALYQQNMASDEREAAAFVDDLIEKPPSAG